MDKFWSFEERLTSTALNQEVGQITSQARDVHTLCARFSRTAEGSTTSLGGRTIPTVVPAGLNRVLAWTLDTIVPLGRQCLPKCFLDKLSCCKILHMRPVQKEITRQNADEGLFELQPCTRRGLQFGISGASKSLIGGTLELAPDAYIVFDSTCVDLLLRDVCIKGGTVVCHGSGCCVIFNDVSFEGCSLVVRDGACVALEHSTFDQDVDHAQPSGISILAHGKDTSVGGQYISIHGGVQGVAVQEGACFAASHLTVVEVAMTAVEADGQSSGIKLTDCVLKDFLPVYNHTFSVRGVHAHSNSSAELQTLTVSGGVFGVDVRDGAQAELTDCILKDAMQSCAAFRDAAYGRLEDCVLERTNASLPLSFGLFMSGAGTLVEASGTKFLKHGQSGAFVHERAAMTARSCASTANRVAGFVVHSSGTMELNDCSSDQDGKGCLVEEKGVLKATGVDVVRCEDEAFAIGEEGIAELIECSGTECGEEGLKAAHEGTHVQMTACTFSRNQFDNVSVRQGATAAIQRCSLSHSAQRSGIAAKGAETSVELHGCMLEGNAKCGAIADEGSTVGVRGCTSVGNKEAGYKSQSGGKMGIFDSSSAGDSTGCDYVEGGGLMVWKKLIVDGVSHQGPQ